MKPLHSILPSAGIVLLVASSLSSGCGTALPEDLAQQQSSLTDFRGQAITADGEGIYCLDVSGGVVANGTKVQLWQCNGTPAQKWQMVNGVLHSGLNYNYCLDISGGNLSSGTNLWLWPCNGTAAQNFIYNSFGNNGFQSFGNFQVANNPSLYVDFAAGSQSGQQPYPLNGMQAIISTSARNLVVWGELPLNCGC